MASTVSEAVARHGATSNGRRRSTDGAAEAARDELERGKEEGPLTHLQMTPPAKSRNMLDIENDQT
jgi:hypothetical protein